MCTPMAGGARRGQCGTVKNIFASHMHASCINLPRQPPKLNPKEDARQNTVPAAALHTPGRIDPEAGFAAGPTRRFTAALSRKEPAPMVYDCARRQDDRSLALLLNSACDKNVT